MNALRDVLAARGAEAQIKPIARRNPMPEFDRTASRRRNRIERVFRKITQFRAIAPRCEKHDENVLYLIRPASIRIRLRHQELLAEAWHRYGCAWHHQPITQAPPLPRS